MRKLIKRDKARQNGETTTDVQAQADARRETRKRARRQERARLIDILARTTKASIVFLEALPLATLRQLERGATNALLPGEVPRYSLYRISFDDGTAYIGITSREITRRLKEHIGDDGPPSWWMQPKLDAGVSFRCVCLASELTEQQADELERFHIQKLEKPLNKVHAKKNRYILPKPFDSAFASFIYDPPTGDIEPDDYKPLEGKPPAIQQYLDLLQEWAFCERGHRTSDTCMVKAQGYCGRYVWGGKCDHHRPFLKDAGTPEAEESIFMFFLKPIGWIFILLLFGIFHGFFLLGIRYICEFLRDEAGFIWSWCLQLFERLV